MSQEKVKSLEELRVIVEDLKVKGKKIVLCHGLFDLMHPGHTAHLESAGRYGDILVVTITSDKFANRGPGRPIFNQDLRAREVASRQIVDYVAINNNPTAEKPIKILKPDFYCKGPDYKDKQLDLTGKIKDEEKAVKECGGQLVITDDFSYSSSSLINQYLSDFDDSTKMWVDKFKQTHTSDSIINSMRSLRDLRCIVIGEAIIDEYAYCEVLGASPKDSILTARHLETERFAGGSLAVANHIADFVDSLSIVYLTNGEEQNFISDNLKGNVDIYPFQSKDSTIVKRRFIEKDSLKKLFGLEYIPKIQIDGRLELNTVEFLEKDLPNYDLVIVTDFGHGFLTEKIVRTICTKSNFLAVNSQTNSANRGFNIINNFFSADYISLDELELRLSYLDNYTKLEDLVRKNQGSFTALTPSLMSVTRGSKGSIVITKDAIYEVPSLTNKVVDTVGAGDAYLAISSLCAARNFSPELIGFIGNAVGAIAANIVGNKKPVESVELYKFIERLLK